MSYRVAPATAPLAGAVDVPGDKSIGHRALLFSLLGRGPVRIAGLGGGADNGRTARAVVQLGGRVERDGDVVVVTGAGLHGLRAPGTIDCGNSGTTIRLLTGLLAGQRFAATLTGDPSLSRRPMRRVIDPLVAMGARIDGQAAGDDLTPPLHLAGLGEGQRLRGRDHALAVASAQVKTALILAGLYADGVTRVREPGPSRDHSERLLAAMGAPVRVPGPGQVEIDPSAWPSTGPSTGPAASSGGRDGELAVPGGALTVPGDPSSAAFIVAAALVAGADRVVCRGVCVNPTRTGFLDVLAAMGATVEQVEARTVGGEPVADLVVSGAAGGLRATTVAGDVTVRAIDEVPVLAAVAARAAGVTEFRDAGELRVKESDRIATTVAMLRGFGVEAEATADGLAVTGAPERPLAAARIDSAGDHRIAMAGTVLALAGAAPSRIDDVANVATSFPAFVDVMRGLGVDLRVEP